MFVLLPTKEMVYSPLISDPEKEYSRCVTAEASDKLELLNYCKANNLSCYDVASWLQPKADTEQLYPPTFDGHPSQKGYNEIAIGISKNLIQQ